MGNFFPIGNQSLLTGSTRGKVINPAPVIVGTIPLQQINGTVYPTNAVFQTFSQVIAALAAGGKATIIPGSANQRWVVQILLICASVAGNSALLEGATSLAPFTAIVNQQIAPFGQIPYYVISNNVGSTLEIINNGAGAVTYQVTCFGTYMTN